MYTFEEMAHWLKEKKKGKRKS